MITKSTRYYITDKSKKYFYSYLRNADTFSNEKTVVFSDKKEAYTNTFKEAYGTLESIKTLPKVLQFSNISLNIPELFIMRGETITSISIIDTIIPKEEIDNLTKSLELSKKVKELDKKVKNLSLTPAQIDQLSLILNQFEE